MILMADTTKITDNFTFLYKKKKVPKLDFMQT